MATRQLQKKSSLTAAQIAAIDQYLVIQCGWRDAWISDATREQVAKKLFASKKAGKK